jgi:hypothetical protein
LSVCGGAEHTQNASLLYFSDRFLARLYPILNVHGV